MKPFRGLVLGGALALLLTATNTASAAWNNVFQATFFHHNKPAQSNYYAVPVAVPVAPPTAAYSSPCGTPCASPCDPCQKCTTNYVQRSYYQPVTVMQTKTYYEPVTTYQTSYYYEPVTSVRYSCYYDPCSCSYQQVAIPTTSYCLKSKCCPVQSWVQKNCQVPTTAYQLAYYWEPHTTCCKTTVGAPIFPGCAPGAPAVPGAPVMPPAGGAPIGGPPPVTDQGVPSGPPPVKDKYYYNPGDKTGPPPVSDSSQTKFNQPQLGSPVPGGQPAAQPAAPKNSAPLDKIASLPGGSIKGQVVSSGNSPKANTQVIFMPVSLKGQQQAVTANASGQFNVSLASGQWEVYIADGAGQPKYHSKIHIAENQPSYLTLVSK